MTYIIFSSSIFELSVFARVLLAGDNSVIFTGQREKVRELLERGMGDILIAEEKYLDLVRECAAAFPMIPAAVISARSKAQFHQRTEGLGVFMQIPPLAEKDDALKIQSRGRELRRGLPAQSA